MRIEAESAGIYWFREYLLTKFRSKRVTGLIIIFFSPLRERLSGVKPPVLRSEIDFDPGSKYHVPANIPYIG